MMCYNAMIVILIFNKRIERAVIINHIATLIVSVTGYC